MADRSKIEWTDATWNPVTGCTKVSPGCKHCYAETLARRLQAMGNPRYRNGFEVTLHPDVLSVPLRWRKPRRVFVCSMADLFHEQVPNEFIAAVFGVMAACPEHTFIVCTKRAERMAEWFAWVERAALGMPCPAATDYFCCLHGGRVLGDAMPPFSRPGQGWPRENIHLLVTAEDQEMADKRIPLLLQCPAAVHGVSVEPMLGEVELGGYLAPGMELCSGCEPAGLDEHGEQVADCPGHAVPGLGWVVVGGESGPRARPCDIAWIRSAVEQCRDAEVPAFVKQDSGPRSGMQGRIPDDLWATKELPEVQP